MAEITARASMHNDGVKDDQITFTTEQEHYGEIKFTMTENVGGKSYTMDSYVMMKDLEDFTFAEEGMPKNTTPYCGNPWTLTEVVENENGGLDLIGEYQGLTFTGHLSPQKLRQASVVLLRSTYCEKQALWGDVDEAMAQGLKNLNPNPVGQTALGSRQSNLGGGGTADGLGGLGVVGTGDGRSGYGQGGGSFGIRGTGGIGDIGGTMRNEGVIVQGALDKSLVDAAVKRNMNQIRHVYQQELNRNANLQGPIIVRFTIGADGSVTQVEALDPSSAENADLYSRSDAFDSQTLTDYPDQLERMMQGLEEKFQGFQFPEPSDGGDVIVTYPFAFHPG